MAAPLYFFPRKTLSDVVDVQADRFRPPVLRECGLEETFSDVTSVRAQTATNELTVKGPGGASGVLTTILPASGQCPLRTGFHPDFQTWTQAGRELWIGTDNEHRPRPSDLLRSNSRRTGATPKPLHDGHSITLGDGHDWEVPVIRRPPAMAQFGSLTALPKNLGWDLDGRFVESLKPEYQAIWEDTSAICDLFFDEEGRLRDGEYQITVETALGWCLRILGLNYRLGRHEQNLLRLIDQSNVFTVLFLAVDGPRVMHLLKKKPSPSTAEAVST